MLNSVNPENFVLGFVVSVLPVLQQGNLVAHLKHAAQVCRYSCQPLRSNLKCALLITHVCERIRENNP